MYIDFNKENNKESTKFKVGDNVRISQYKNIFAKVYVPNWSEEDFVIKKVKNTVPWTYVISDLNVEEILGTFSKKDLQKANTKGFTAEKVTKGKGDQTYAKWNDYDCSFNGWIEKKYINE